MEAGQCRQRNRQSKADMMRLSLIILLLAAVAVAPVADATDPERIIVTNARMVGRDAAAQDVAVNVLIVDGKLADVTKDELVPANPPAKDFWALTMYDNQTRSMLQTSQALPTVGSATEGLRQNVDGSFDIYFSPKPPKGYENNWLATVPGKGWFVALRMYGPLEAWIEKTWRPGEIDLVK